MIQRCHLAIRGAVQGVGFRPFIYRLATAMGLTGWVNNSSQGVFIEAEGQKDILASFILRIEKEKPPRSFIQSIETTILDVRGYTTFSITESADEGPATALVLPDIATCPDCLNEIFDPSNRRYLYPFTNCTNCGPRFTIITALPYDRVNTTMRQFTMCENCRGEYEDPANRRFHAEPNACPVCGPRLELRDSTGSFLATRDDAMILAANAILIGQIVAVKGIGGFHLLCDARNEGTVARLRERKHREEKPFAVLYPYIHRLKTDCEVSALEERLLLSPESPIVLLRRKSQSGRHIAKNVAPDNPYLGVMLPYAPLHHILMRNLGIPVVATSGNLSDEPICTDEDEAVRRLGSIADSFLTHNRPIVRHADDSIARVMLGREQILRRARGYAPLPVELNGSAPSGAATVPANSILALGAHLKNTIALTSGNNVFISQHIGDLETRDSFDAFEHVIKSFKKLYHADPKIVVADMHPSYLSTQYGETITDHLYRVQHHYAHVTSCMADNQLDGTVLGVSWDGTGYGTDGTIWGGEFLLTDESSFRRVATFRSFKLPGGEKAIREPKRTALGMLYETFGNQIFRREDLIPLLACTPHELEIYETMLEQDINAPATSSVGRLFDGVASLLGLCHASSFEGQAAMAIEFAACKTLTEKLYPFSLHPETIDGNTLYVVDWSMMIAGIINDIINKKDVAQICAAFHNTLAAIVLAVARKFDENRVVLSGGCFQNRCLSERTVELLQREGFKPYWHQRVPPNDGGISLGQVYAFLRMKPDQKTLPLTHLSMLEILK